MQNRSDCKGGEGQMGSTRDHLGEISLYYDFGTNVCISENSQKYTKKTGLYRYAYS